MEITLKPTVKQHEAYEALKTKRKVFFGGGAGGGKSWWLCESRLINALMRPGYKSFIGREELKRLMQSTYITFTKVSAYHKIPEGTWKLNGQYNYIDFANGSRIDLLDLKYLPSDPLYERFGSLEYTDGAIEEAGEVHPLAYDVIQSRIGRHENDVLGIKPTLAVTGNPKKNWTYYEFYKPWMNNELPEDTAFIQSLYSDNPYTAESYGEQLKGLKDEQLKQRLMYGNWEYDDDPSILMEWDAINDLFTNTINKDKHKFITADIARFGKDKTVIMVWQGLEVFEVHQYETSSLDFVAGEIKRLAQQHQVPFSHIIADESGVGGGVIDMLRGIKGFVSNATPFEVIQRHKMKPENFQNLKTQCYYKLAEMVNNRQIAVRIEDVKVRDLLTEELSQIRSKDRDKEGKLKIESKETIIETLGRSPDYADALMMRMYFEYDQTRTDKIKISMRRYQARRGVKHHGR